MLLLSILAALLSPALAADEVRSEERVRGDLPHTPVDLPSLLNTEVAPGDAAILFDELRAILLERMGADIVTEDQLYLGAMQGMLLAIDEQLRKQESPAKASLPASSMLLHKAQAEALGDGLGGHMTGIGIEFELYGGPGVLVVSRVLPDSPAERSGILADDRIIAINNQRFQSRSLGDVVAMLQGAAGTTVQLEVVRRAAGTAQRFSVTLERSRFKVRSVEDGMQDNGVGYIRISRFHRRTPSEVESSIRRLAKLGADQLILDLRDSSGGDLMAAVEVADLFVPAGAILLRLVEPGIGAQDIVARHPCLSHSQLVILVNRWTLGAAESLAATLQEQGRAYVMGESTMGSARSETLIDLGSSLVLRLESVRLQTPSGKSWQRRGLDPDLPMWNTAMPLRNPLGWVDQARSDLLFDTAVHYLETQVEAPR